MWLGACQNRNGETVGKLDDRTVLVSGGARGIGAAIARAVVGEGGRMVIGDVLDDDGAQIVTELGEERARFVHLDVTDGAQWRDAVATAESTFGPMSVLVNNAGIVRWGTVADLDPAVWQEVLDVNLTGVFLGMQAAIPSLRRAGGGSIVNVSSTAGLVGYAFEPAYVASKWGVRGLTKSAALELARDGIRVNSVHPGLTRTPMTELTDPALIALRDQVLALQPIPRMGEADEVARLVMFLASDDSSFSTGSEFVVDGGSVTGQVPPTAPA
jgi:3alpha(or 20beta)-hydroxysteroid dehydrogenase